MIQKIFEDKYTTYSPIYKLKALSEYYGKIPKTSTTKYVKFLKFSGETASIYNISEILITPNVAEGGDGVKKVHIMCTGDESSKVMTCKKFADLCKKIFKALKDANEDEVEVESVIEGSNKPTKFRFYFDSDNNFAILVNGTNTKGLETFLENYEGDLAAAVSVPKSTKAPKEPKEPRQKREKKPKKLDPHEGYVKISSSNEHGHKVIMWKKVDAEDSKEDKKEDVPAES